MPSKYGKGKRTQKVKVTTKEGKVFFRDQIVGSNETEDLYKNKFGVEVMGDMNEITHDMLYTSLHLMNNVMPIKQLNQANHLKINVVKNFSGEDTSMKVTGKYDDADNAIHISPQYKHLFAHEYGHYLKDLIESSNDTSAHKKLQGFIGQLQRTDILTRVKDTPLLSKENPRGLTYQQREEYFNWFKSPDEMFARFFEQYVGYKLGENNQNRVAHNYSDYLGKPQFYNEYEFNYLKDDFEDMMTKVFGNEIIEKTLGFLLEL